MEYIDCTDPKCEVKAKHYKGVIFDEPGEAVFFRNVFSAIREYVGAESDIADTLADAEQRIDRILDHSSAFAATLISVAAEQEVDLSPNRRSTITIRGADFATLVSVAIEAINQNPEIEVRLNQAELDYYLPVTPVDEETE